MKKLIFAGVCVCLLCCVAGCGNEVAESNVEECVDFILENVTFEDTLEELSLDIVEWRYCLVDGED